MPGIYSLKGEVKHYDWGGLSFIPNLLQVPNTSRKPFAEYWLGVHPLGPAAADTGGSTATPLTVLAPGLSFLLKILDIRDMLSIQVHPSKSIAEAGFAAEEAAGIPPDASHRNYKDPNHKPELSVALSEFWLLHGFKPEAELSKTLQELPEFQTLVPVFQSEGHTGLYKYIMEMDQSKVNSMLSPLLERLRQIQPDQQPDKSDPAFWVLRTCRNHEAGQDLDRGLFSIYFMNIVRLEKGQGIFQDAGVLHAYLEGQIVEIMANSDNVLRGGLTTKHIDIPELLRNVEAVGMVPDVLEGKLQQDAEFLYQTPYPDFQLSRIELEAGDTYSFEPATEEILLLTSGSAELDDDQVAIRLKPGNPAAVAFPGQTLYLAAAARSTVFRARGTFHNR